MGGEKGVVKTAKKKEKKEKIVKRVFLDTGERVYLAVKGPGKYLFAYLNDDGQIALVNEVVIDGVKYRPLDPLVKNKDDEIKELPVGYPSDSIVTAPEMSTEELFEKIKSHMKKYVDLPEDDLEMAVFFAMSTWFYPKSDTVAYLRFLGDTGKGKSRMLTVTGDLCFYPLMLGGSATRSAIMRTHEKFHGTLVLDEADLAGDKENEITKYINTGFERRKVTILTNKQDPSKIEIYDPFGPKLFAMRQPFRDSATEGRLLSISPYETRRMNIPVVIFRKYYREAQELKDALAAWTLRNWKRVSGEMLDVVQELPVEPRLKQLAAPLSVILPLFKEDTSNQFIRWILRRQRKIAEQRANSDEGTVFNAIVDLCTGIITPKQLPDKYEKYVNYAYTESSDDEGALMALTAGMVREVTGMGMRRLSRTLTELGFFIDRKTRVVQNTKIRGRFLYTEDTRRWAEDWEKYRYGEAIIEVPEILRHPERSYEPVIAQIPDATPQTLKLLEQELDDGETVRCSFKKRTAIFSQMLGRDLVVPAGAKLRCPLQLAERLLSADSVELEEQ